MRDELERKVEAASADELDQRLHARRNDALLPAGYDRAVSPRALGELGLREAGSESCLSDQGSAAHLD